MKTSSIGLFFGSFNPVHLGHVQLANYLLQHTDLDEIWFVVSPCNPLKQARTDLIDEHLRLKMINVAISQLPYMHSCDIEFALPRPSYTANTLRILSKKYPDKQFTLIIGSDNMAVFDKWREYRYILDNYNILVYPRIGNKCMNLIRKFPQMHIIEAPLLPISSTEIRRLIQQKKDASQWLHPDVLQLINRNHLYGY